MKGKPGCYRFSYAIALCRGNAEVSLCEKFSCTSNLMLKTSELYHYIHEAWKSILEFKV